MIMRPRSNFDSGHTCNGCHCLTPKTECLDTVEVIDLPDLGGGMLFKTERQICWRHTRSVILYLNQSSAGLCDDDSNFICSCINSIIQQLLDDRCRTLDHLAGSNFAGKLRGHSLYNRFFRVSLRLFTQW